MRALVTIAKLGAVVDLLAEPCLRLRERAALRRARALEPLAADPEGLLRNALALANIHLRSRASMEGISNALV